MDNMPKILHIIIKKEPYSEILAGKKTEEVRELCPFWDSRLIEFVNDEPVWRQYDIIRFHLGYTKTFTDFKYNGTTYDEEKESFVVSIGTKI